MTDDKFKVSITGPGLTFNQSVEKAQANAIMSFFLTGAPLSPGRYEISSGANVESHVGDASLVVAKNGARQTIKEFLKAKRPNTQYERVACIAFYLTHVDNISEFKTADITNANIAAAQQKISNPSQVVADVTNTYGYLSAAGKGTKQISVLGEAVVAALPDREAVKAAIVENRPKRKSKRSSKKKK